MLSIVTPAFNEEKNLPLLYEGLRRVCDGADFDWEWIVIDDHSSDRTFGVINDLARRDGRIRGIRLARNFGSHTALTCGLHQARGDCAVVMASDLQDPPETIPALLEKWREGDHVVWAVRAQRHGEKASTLWFSWLYYWIMRRIVGLKELPATGADFFLVDRRVLEAFRQFKESNTSIVALITWMGYRQSRILYDRQARLHGKSGWSLQKKLKMVVDSVTSFTYLPIRTMSYIGFLTASLGLLYSVIVILNALLGHPAQGWSSLMVVVLVLGGLQMLMIGVLGEYIWRALDEARQRPLYLIEATTAPDDVHAGGDGEQAEPGRGPVRRAAEAQERR